jgi:hypothetical protein
MCIKDQVVINLTVRVVIMNLDQNSLAREVSAFQLHGVLETVATSDSSATASSSVNTGGKKRREAADTRLLRSVVGMPSSEHFGSEEFRHNL